MSINIKMQKCPAFSCLIPFSIPFLQIKLSFLMVGHTHEDIDQMFSCFSRHLAKHDARTIPELFSEMESAYISKPICEQLLHMFDVKQWLHGHTEANISGHVYQHQFKIEMKDGKVVTYYKKWSTTKNWILLKPKDNPDSNYSIIHSVPKVHLTSSSHLSTHSF